MTAETVIRWTATAAALAALVWLAYLLAGSVSPLVAAAVVLVVTGAVAGVLWHRALDERAIRAEQDQARARVEHAVPAPPSQY